MSQLRRYKDTLVGHGSALEAALILWDKAKSGKDQDLAKKLKSDVEKIYETTTEAYKRLYPDPAHRQWFQEKSFPPKPQLLSGADHGTHPSDSTQADADSNASRDVGAGNGQV